MNLNELKLELLKENVPEDMYSINGGLPNETYCINQNYALWEVFYSERGNKNSLKTFHNEDEACSYFYNWIKETLKLMR